MTNTYSIQAEIIAPKVEKREYELPPAGPISATLKHIKDEGMTTHFGDKPKHTIVFGWETDAIDSHGAPIMVFERMTLTLSHMGHLASRIEALTGTLPREDERYPVHTLVGKRAMLIIKYRKTDKGTYANVAGAFPAGETNTTVQVNVRKPETATDDKTPSAAPAASTATAKAAVLRKPADSKPVISVASSQQADNSELPPEPCDLDAGDDGTNFPGDDAASDENAA